MEKIDVNLCSYIETAMIRPTGLYHFDVDLISMFVVHKGHLPLWKSALFS